MGWSNAAWVGFQSVARKDICSIRRRASALPGIRGATARLRFVAATECSLSMPTETKPTLRAWRVKPLHCFRRQTQNVIHGYLAVGAGAVAPSFPASFYSIPNQVVWPYMQQWHLDVQHEMPSHIVTTFSYVGSKGTHLGRQRDLNQLFPTAVIGQSVFCPANRLRILSATLS